MGTSGPSSGAACWCVANLKIAELHDYAGPRGRLVGMPLDQFTEIAYRELLAGDDLILIDSIAIEPREDYTELLEKRRSIFNKMSKGMLAHIEL